MTYKVSQESSEVLITVAEMLVKLENFVENLRIFHRRGLKFVGISRTLRKMSTESKKIVQRSSIVISEFS